MIQIKQMTFNKEGKSSSDVVITTFKNMLTGKIIWHAPE